MFISVVLVLVLLLFVVSVFSYYLCNVFKLLYHNHVVIFVIYPLLVKVGDFSFIRCRSIDVVIIPFNILFLVIFGYSSGFYFFCSVVIG